MVRALSASARSATHPIVAVCCVVRLWAGEERLRGPVETVFELLGAVLLRSLGESLLSSPEQLGFIVRKSRSASPRFGSGADLDECYWQGHRGSTEAIKAAFHEEFGEVALRSVLQRDSDSAWCDGASAQRLSPFSDSSDCCWAVLLRSLGESLLSSPEQLGFIVRKSRSASPRFGSGADLDECYWQGHRGSTEAIKAAFHEEFGEEQVALQPEVNINTKWRESRWSQLYYDVVGRQYNILISTSQSPDDANSAKVQDEIENLKASSSPSSQSD
nr:hypothetical protein Iba_chr14dCG1500 [Ipomoea batatas]